jgi:hypothetical protein
MFDMATTNPVNVTRFGAIHVGRRDATGSHQTL